MSLIGRLLYKLYYLPKSRKVHIEQFGGVDNYRLMEKGEADMKAYAFNNLLFKYTPNQRSKYHLNYLTGEKYLHQSLFCVYSLFRHLTLDEQSDFSIIFYDDGSLTSGSLIFLKLKHPFIQVVSAQQTQQKMDELLPADRYPFLHKKRAVYPHIKKLIDVHLGARGWQIVLDSDMLFFNKPVQLLDWLKKPQQPFFLFDPISSYHYSFPLMEELTGYKLNAHLNVGVAALKSEDINWDILEFWVKTLEENEGTSYLLEQALIAMLVAGKEIIVADQNAYVVKPGQNEVQAPTAVLHHYVAESKEWYYKTGWRQTC